MINHRMFLWGVGGAWLGVLVGIVILFLNYMQPQRDHSAERVNANMSRQIGWLAPGPDRTEVVKTTANALVKAGETNEAILIIQIIDDEEDRRRAFIDLLENMEGMYEDSSMSSDARKAALPILKAAIPKLFNSQGTQVSVLVAVAQAFQNAGAVQEARSILEEATHKLQYVQPTTKLVTSTANTDTKDSLSTSRPWSGWWPIGLAVIGFVAATTLKPILEALGKLIAGSLIVRISKDDRLRKALLHEAKSEAHMNERET